MKRGLEISVMMKPQIEIRQASIDDAAALLAIYAPYVERTPITFEYDVPSEQEFAQRIVRVQEKFPWLVAVCDGRIVGYAYASPFRTRAAYRHTVETSVYVELNHRRDGVGRSLYTELERRLAAQGILNLCASIAYVEPEDEYLTHDSVHFHERMGYVKVAHFHQCGFKFNRWYDMIWMEKMIGSHDTPPEP